MRSRSPLSILTLALSATGFLIPPNFLEFNSFLKPHCAHISQAPEHHLSDHGGLQSPMNPGPVEPQPPTWKNPPSSDTDGNSDLTISDILPRTRQINIFASLTRDISSVSSRLESALPNSNTTLLAPLNSVMQNLPRKPWEDNPDAPSTAGVSAERNEDKAAANIQKFVEMHVIPVSPWQEGEQGKVKTLGGKELWWEKRNGKKVLMPGDIEVDGVLGRVGNGEIWGLKGVVNYQ